MNEHSGRMDIHISHELSSVENMKKLKHAQLCDDFYINAVVEVRGGMAAGRA